MLTFCNSSPITGERLRSLSVYSKLTLASLKWRLIGSAWSRSRLAQNSCGDLKKNSFLDRDGRWEPLNDEANGMIPLQGVN